MSQLPVNWKTSALGEIADTQLGKMLNKSKQTGKSTVPYLRSLNVQWGSIDVDDLNAMDIELNERDKFTAKKGDLLVCEGGESGRAAIWQGDEPIGFQNALHRIRPTAEIETRYLFYYFEWIVKNRLIDHLFNGVTIKHFSQENLRAVMVSYPSIAEQRQIIEVLEDHLSRLDAALIDLDHISVRCNRLLSRIEQDLATSKSYEKVNLGDIATDVRYGTSEKCAVDATGPMVLRIPNVLKGKIDLNDVKFALNAQLDLSNILLTEGDLLVIRTNGSKPLVGRSAVVQTGVEAAYASYLIRFRFDQLRVKPEWVQWMLSMKVGREQIDRMAASSAGQHNISGTSLKSISIPLPSLEEQVTLLQQRDTWRIRIQHVLAITDPSKQYGSDLRRSLLQAAFTGQLNREVTHV